MIDLRKLFISLGKRMRRSTRRWTRSNCIIFAVSLFLHRWLKGRHERREWDVVPPESYLVIRLSRTPLALFHFMYGEMDSTTGQVKVVSYKPRAGEKSGIAPIFRGCVQRGDKKPAPLPRGVAIWLAYMRRMAAEGGIGWVPVQTSGAGHVCIGFDEIREQRDSEELLAHIQERCRQEQEPR